MDRQLFRQEVERTLADLRDTVRLQTLPLAQALVPHVPRAERGWELSRYMLGALSSLHPPDDASHDQDWVRQRYAILTLRYANGLSPDQVADRLAISRRHFYRQLQHALDEFADFLWERFELGAGEQPGSLENAAEPSESQLLWRESASLTDVRQGASLGQVVRNVLSILEPILRARAVTLRSTLSPELPEVSLGEEILKQLLFALLGEAIACADLSAIEISATEDGGQVRLTILEEAACGADPTRLGAAEKVREKASVQLAALQGASVQILAPAPGRIAYIARLPGESPRAVLVIDDNEDVCQLLRRYLLSGGYQPIIASTAVEALRIARSQALSAITLDLMMSDVDGWDLLHMFRQEPATARIPIIVCSVLDQEDLAMTLGARAFVKKPVMREQLLTLLNRLGAEPHPAPASRGTTLQRP
jgi:CheY-like chemotaxis protein